MSIKRETRRKFNLGEKISITLEGLKGEKGIAAIWRQEGIASKSKILVEISECYT